MATHQPQADKATITGRSSHDREPRTDTGREQLLAQIQADFNARLAAMATEPARWIEFIDQAAALDAGYSLGNQLLLIMQAHQRDITPRYFLPYGKKDGSTGWKAQHRHVRQGETAFKIWAPIRRRPTDQEAAAAEAAGRAVVRDPSGRPAIQLVGFKLANTFELSQTDGEPFEPPTVRTLRRTRIRGNGPQLLTGDDSTGLFADLVTLIHSHHYHVETVPPHTGYLGSANGVTINHPSRRLVQLRDDVEPAQLIKTTAHELAHIRCGHLDHTSGTSRLLHRGRQETEAESVAHLVLKALGIDSAAYSDAYVLGWADGDLELVKDCATTVLRVARQILDDLTPPEDADSDPIRPDDPATATAPSRPGPTPPEPTTQPHPIDGATSRGSQR